MKNRKIFYWLLDAFLLVSTSIVILTPFVFMLLNSFKNRKESGMMNFTFPTEFLIGDNYTKVFKEQNYMLVRAFFNSTVITVGALILLVLICSMSGYILQRRRGKATGALNLLFLSGLMLPPAILPTIWVMQTIGIYRSLAGMVLVEVALSIPFAVMLYRGFMYSVPKEVEESAYVDGCGRLRMFFQIVFPLLKPVTATIIVLNAVTIFNDFVNPLYFLPGAENATIQLTLYNFIGRYGSSWNLLFANVILITLPPFILFIFFNKKIVAGMTAGAVKG